MRNYAKLLSATISIITILMLLAAGAAVGAALVTAIRHSNGPLTAPKAAEEMTR